MGPKFDTIYPHLCPRMNDSRLNREPRRIGVRRCRAACGSGTSDSGETPAETSTALGLWMPSEASNDDPLACRRVAEELIVGDIHETAENSFFSSFHLKVDPDTPARCGTLQRPPHALRARNGKSRNAARGVPPNSSASPEQQKPSPLARRHPEQQKPSTTGDSRAIPQPSTNPAHPCLSSMF